MPIRTNKLVINHDEAPGYGYIQAYAEHVFDASCQKLNQRGWRNKQYTTRAFQGGMSSPAPTSEPAHYPLYFGQVRHKDNVCWRTRSHY